jgi:Pyruvate/2-oxoacid:ferredoxin oxidoreductase delta subunit
MRYCRKIWWGQRDPNGVTIWRIRVVYWISKATSTHMYAHASTHMYAHARTRVHTHTLIICNIYCFSKATIVTRKHTNVTLYVHCRSC